MFRAGVLLLGLVSNFSNAANLEVSDLFKSLFNKSIVVEGTKIIGFEEIDQLIDSIDDAYWSHFSLVYDSRSVQFGSAMFPRIILFRDSLSPIVAFTGHASLVGGENIEIAHYSYSSHVYTYYKLEKKPEGIVYEKNPRECFRCHRQNLRPNWDPYVLWPGTYGSLDDEILVGSKEDQMFREFVKENREKFRYKKLKGLRRYKEPFLEVAARPTSFSEGRYRIIPDPIFSESDAQEAHWNAFYGKHKAFYQQYSKESGMPQALLQPYGIPRSPQRINAHLGNTIFDQNSDRIIHELEQLPGFANLRYALLYGLLCNFKYEEAAKLLPPPFTAGKKSYLEIYNEIDGAYSLADLMDRAQKYTTLTDKTYTVLEKSRGLGVGTMAGFIYLTQNEKLKIPYTQWATTKDIPYVFDDGLDGPRRFAAILLRTAFQDQPEFLKKFYIIDVEGYGEAKWIVMPKAADCGEIRQALVRAKAQADTRRLESQPDR